MGRVQAQGFHSNDRFWCHYHDSELTEPKNRSSALLIKILLLKVFPCSNSQEVE